MLETAKSSTSDKSALKVSLVVKHSVTKVCLECKASFETMLFSTGRQQRSFCSDACRQVAYRKSPAHRKCLDGLRNQRLNRRNTQVRRKNRDKAFYLDCYSGHVVDSVPSVGSL